MLGCLRSTYNKANGNGDKILEIIYCHSNDPCDFTSGEDDLFIDGMPWLVLPRDDPRFFKISKRFQVKTKPRFILITPQGEVLDENAEKAYFQGNGNHHLETIINNLQDA